MEAFGPRHTGFYVVSTEQIKLDIRRQIHSELGGQCSI